ncbi:hypothetical protein [Paraglaciecola hydrolytica]|uniref:Uncharacterized protein n=1 Tax=Paraglaciecola hydrolytica TaxID=1799789 RepID=A0A148KKK0_9ALTE|nr:hypothetical protein [Paraglaciecola hydrolytica]KXI26791.1 hypothetical protein AX660_03205 [Paraglaciecola hydrolytica]
MTEDEVKVQKAIRQAEYDSELKIITERLNNAISKEKKQYASNIWGSIAIFALGVIIFPFYEPARGGGEIAIWLLRIAGGGIIGIFGIAILFSKRQMEPVKEAQKSYDINTRSIKRKLEKEIENIDKEKYYSDLRAADKALDKQKAKEKEAQHQVSLASLLPRLNQEAINMGEKLPITLTDASIYLCEVKELYNRSLFSPFWDKIEEIYSFIGSYYDTLSGIKDNAITFQKACLEYKGAAPQFIYTDDDIIALSKIDEFITELNKTIEIAQADFNFALIYEARRTNQLLIAGFTNLSSAISGMKNQLSNMTSTLGAELRNIHSSQKQMHNEVITLQNDKLMSYERNAFEMNNLMIGQHNQLILQLRGMSFK